jgi:molecular chaperone GrpE
MTQNKKNLKKDSKKQKKNNDLKLKKLEKKFINTTNEFNEEKNKLLRNIADLQNQLKRSEKNHLIEKNKIKKKYLLYIVDTLEILTKAYNDKNSKNGIKLIINNIKDILKDEKIEYINCIGKEFNHNIHHAISTIDKKNCKDNIIIEEIKKGYYLENDILRPSQVIVQKKIN